jgi:hypothetical protein
MKKEVSPSDTLIRILKIGTCTSLSGRSELTYHLGCNAESEIHFRVVQNSGNGQFNAELGFTACDREATDSASCRQTDDFPSHATGISWQVFQQSGVSVRFAEGRRSGQGG